MFAPLAFFFLLSLEAVARPLDPSGIIGGGIVKAGSFPFLINRNKQCGGALIAKDWFLTGAHCDMYVGEFVDIHRHDLLASEIDGERVRIAEVHVYPDYDIDDAATDLHDIKLVRLAEPVRNTTPARLVTQREELFLERPGQLLTVAGWGAITPTDVRGVGVTTLRAVQVPVVANDVCNDAQHYGGIKVVFDSMLCAGYDEGGRDACVGDSGGPIFAILEGEGVIVGVISWALGCAEPFRLGVYTRVASYRGWITYTMSVRNAFPYPPLPPLNSCQYACGSHNMQSGCFCAQECVEAGTCCEDYNSLCLSESPSLSNGQNFAAQEIEWLLNQPSSSPTDSVRPSCLGVCGQRVSLPDDRGSCACDEACLQQGDCCDDFYLRCSTQNQRCATF